jgi:serine/threonine protein kinase/Flp pilus assembly protein TadD
MKCPACQFENPAGSRYCPQCGSAVGQDASPTLPYSREQETAVAETLRFNPGDRFGDRYTIIEEIGRGGMGRVYKAEDRELGTTIVLKMIRPDLSTRPRMVDQFRKETLLGRSVSHENIVRIHDLGEVDKIKYISMDFVKGENLADLIRTSGSLTPAACLQIARQICRALRAAHEKGIVHGDIKPQNIMVDNTGKVYVTDFGLASSLSAPRAASGGHLSGTPKYFSPEQARGEEADPRSDIYSLGIVLYEMVTGQAPFLADTLEGYIREHISARPRPPSKWNPSMPSPFEKIILKCLEKRREDRYQAVEELLQDLESQGEGGRGAAAWLASRQGRRVLKASSLVLLLAAVAYGSYRLFLKPPAWPPAGRTSIAVMYAVNNSGDKGLDAYLRWQIPHFLYLELAQSRYFTVLPQDRVMQILSDMKQLDEEYHLSKTLDRIAEAANVSYFVLPNFTKVGDSLWISFTVRKAKTDESLGEPYAVQGKGLADLPAMIQEMSLKVKTRLNLSAKEISGDPNPNLGQITTTSPEALRFYIEGNKFFVQGRFEDSVRALQRAVEEDPSFAMAHLKLAINYDYLGDYGRRQEYLMKARALVDRVSERDRYFIQAYASSSLGSPLDAIESYRKLLAVDPQDEQGLTGLGAIYRNCEDWDGALEQFDAILALNPGNFVALENRAFIHTAMGRYEKALELCEAGPRTAQGYSGFFARQVALLHLIQGRYDLAAADLAKALADVPGDFDILELQGNLRQLMGDLPAARQIYEQLRQTGEAIPGGPNLQGRKWLVCVSLQEGQYRRAREILLGSIALAVKSNRVYDEIEARQLLAHSLLRTGQFFRVAEALRPVLEKSRMNAGFPAQKSLLYLSALASLGMGRIEEARSIGREIARLIETTGFPKQARIHELLQGKIALAEGRADQAVAHIEKAISLLPAQRENVDEQAYYYDALASASYLAGDLHKALETYRAITALTTGRLLWGDIYAHSYYWMGKIRQRTGDTAEAAAEYRRFLQLWENADDGLPETADAQKQLDALRRRP